MTWTLVAQITFLAVVALLCISVLAGTISDFLDRKDKRLAEWGNRQPLQNEMRTNLNELFQPPYPERKSGVHFGSRDGCLVEIEEREGGDDDEEREDPHGRTTV